MTAIYQGKVLYKNGKRYDFPLSFIFDCPDKPRYEQGTEG